MFILFLVSLGILISVDGIIEPGQPWRIWRASGALGALGFISALGFLPAWSIWRFIGAFLSLAAAVFYHLDQPIGVEPPIPFWALTVASAPLCLTSVWCIFMFFIYRRASRGNKRIPHLDGWSKMGSSVLLIVVASHFVFFNYLETRVGHARTVICLDRDTGDIVWQRIGFIAKGGRKHDRNSYATPTPATDGKYVVASFGPGMVCMDFRGNILWYRKEPLYYKFLRYGASSSPVIYRDRVVYTFIAEIPETGNEAAAQGTSYAKHSYIATFDVRTGREFWRATPPEAHESYGTPLILLNQDQPSVLLSTNNHGLAYNIMTGELLWQVNLPITNPIPSFVSGKDTVFMTGGMHGERIAAAIKTGGDGDVTETDVKWRITKGAPQLSSPIYYEDLLYWITEEGIAYCVDSENGEIIWQHRLQGYYPASPVAANGRIYFLNSDGDMTVIQAGRKFVHLAVNSIGEETNTSPAISAGCLFIRGIKHLYCIGNKTSLHVAR